MCGLKKLLLFLKNVGLVFFFLLFSSCGKHYSKNMFMAPSQVFLCIEMPENKLVFENLSIIVYDALWNHFNRVGYNLVQKRRSKKITSSSAQLLSDSSVSYKNYSLKVTIQDVDSSYKFLSPDLLTYATKVKVKLLCQLFDENDILQTQKVFFCTTLIPRARDYVENSSFSDFEYKKLFERYAPKIDYYFRPFLLRKGFV